MLAQQKSGVKYLFSNIGSRAIVFINEDGDVSGIAIAVPGFIYGNLLGSDATDSFIFYENDVIGVVADTTDIAFAFI